MALTTSTVQSDALSFDENDVDLDDNDVIDDVNDFCDGELGYLILSHLIIYLALVYYFIVPDDDNDDDSISVTSSVSFHIRSL